MQHHQVLPIQRGGARSGEAGQRRQLAIWAQKPPFQSISCTNSMPYGKRFRSRPGRWNGSWLGRPVERFYL